MAFSFVTININGSIEEKKKTPYVFSWFLRMKFDIILPQETHGTVSDVKSVGEGGIGKI